MDPDTDPVSLRSIHALLSPVVVTLLQPCGAVFQALGLQEERNFAVYHQVLHRARRSSRAVSRVLLEPLLRHLAPVRDPLIFGIDKTIEQRKEPRIAAKDIYREGCAPPAATSSKPWGSAGSACWGGPRFPGRVGSGPFPF